MSTGLLAALVTQPAAGEVAERILRVAGTSVHYKIVLPHGYDAAKAYPAVLVMGGGPQTMDTVDRTLERNFRAEAEGITPEGIVDRLLKHVPFP